MRSKRGKGEEKSGMPPAKAHSHPRERKLFENLNQEPPRRSKASVSKFRKSRKREGKGEKAPATSSLHRALVACALGEQKEHWRRRKRGRTGGEERTTPGAFSTVVRKNLNPPG